MTDVADQPDPRLAPTIAAVTTIDPVDRREAASQREILRALTMLSAPFDQTAAVTHVTGSAVIVGSRGVVLHLHKRLKRWLQPGGHLDGGEWPHDGATRESHEETGLTVWHPPTGPVLLHVDAHDGGRGHRHLDLRYVLFAGDADPSPPPDESQDCRWFDLDDATAIADAGLRGALRRLRNLDRLEIVVRPWPS
ncbi:hypothetical protein BH24ACT15_BH24ACT15_16050 [soil metagenome]